DQVAEPLLQRALDEELGRAHQLVAQRREDELEQAAAEARPVHALAGRREEHLLDEVSDVLGLGGRCGASAGVDPEGGRDRRHVPTPRGWTTTGTGAPCGAWSAARHRPVLSCKSAGAPFTTTRAAGAIHCTRTHGCGAPGLNAQPATSVWSAIVATGMPPTRT